MSKKVFSLFCLLIALFTVNISAIYATHDGHSHPESGEVITEMHEAHIQLEQQIQEAVQNKEELYFFEELLGIPNDQFPNADSEEVE